MHIMRLVLLCFLCFVVCCLSDPQMDAVHGLLKRILPENALKYIEIDISSDAGDYFEISASGDTKTLIRGSSGVSIAAGVNWYLKYTCNRQLAWENMYTLPLDIPLPPPQVNETIRISSPYPFRYYMNVCTVSYSMSFWDWDRWEKEIDWMALNGVNMPLSFFGQEYVWLKTFEKFGLNKSEVKDFFTGPAFFAWNRMGNIQSWAGELPDDIIEAQFSLHSEIWTRERSFGMKPVLPGFAGHVPRALRKMYPNANISKSQDWGNFGPDYCCVDFLDPRDPLFLEIARTFIEMQVSLLGDTAHLYNMDLFNEMRPPTSDPKYLSDTSKAVLESLQAGDKDAVWVMQGWLFQDTGFWTLEAIQALLSDIPNDKMIILDLYAEKNPVWKTTKSFLGKQFIWCCLHDFGGNMNLFGDLPAITSGPPKASGSSIVGTGMTMEGIFQNYVVYDLVNEMGWRDKPVDLDVWIRDYAIRRYSEENSYAIEAWSTLLKGVYSNNPVQDKSLIVLRPRIALYSYLSGWGQIWGNPLSEHRVYNVTATKEAWGKILCASDSLKNNALFKHDVVDIARQCLNDLFVVAFEDVLAAYVKYSLPDFNIVYERMISIFDDMDQILGSEENFLLGRWLESAKSMGKTDEERELLEFNARNQITRWGPNGEINDYASKQWSGLVSSYYKERWIIFLDKIQDAIEHRQPFDEESYEKAVDSFERSWQVSKNVFPVTPTGDPVAISRKLFEKYYLFGTFVTKAQLSSQTGPTEDAYGQCPTPSTQIFDTTSLGCDTCAATMEPDDSRQVCTCAMTYSKTLGVDKVSFTCASCAAGTVSTQDRTTCLACTTSISGTTNDCVCASNEIIVETDTLGNFLASKVCQLCPSNMYVSSSDAYKCLPCSDDRMTRIGGVSCSCPVGFTTHRGQCIYTTYANAITTTNANKIVFQAVIEEKEGSDTSVTISSDTFDELYWGNAARCKYESNTTACQVLANLCVLQLYDPSTTVCTLYKTLAALKSQLENGIQGWTEDFPWLYYTQTATQAKKSTGIVINVALKEKSGSFNRLEFVFGKYSLSGTFLGFEDLSSQLQLCPDSPHMGAKYLYVGSSTYSMCFYVAANVLKYEETVFYELYLRDSNGILRPCPVVIENYSKDSPIRRFFIYDNVSGKETSSGIPTVIRLPDKITFTVTIQTDDLTLVYPPFVSIHYTERRSSMLSNPSYGFDNVTADEKDVDTPMVEFTTEYTMDFSSFWTNVIIALVAFVMIGVAVWFYRIFCFARHRQNSNIDLEMILHGLSMLMATMSSLFFFLLFIVSVVVFISFKFQTMISILVPPSSELGLFLVLLIFCIVGKLIALCDILWSQTHYDIFFMDWEKPRGRLVPTDTAKKARLAPVSLWRTLFVANEWAELQSHRYIGIEFTLLLLIFCLKGFDLINLSTPQPDYSDLDEAKTNSMLRFAVTTFFWLAIALFQYVVKKQIIYRFFDDPVMNFVDLCSISNVSVFILKEATHGYYIHGRSVHQHADGTMMEMTENLKKEEQGLLASRGLMPDSEEQVFEIYVTFSLRDRLNKTLLIPVARNLAAVRNAPRVRGETRSKSLLPPKSIVRGYVEMNRVLQTVVDDIQTNPDQVRPKTLWQSMVGFPPDLMAIQKELFFEDSNLSFKSVLLAGVEWDLMLFNILIFALMDYLLESVIISALITYVLERLFVFVRTKLGEMNISQKTLVDDRFFL